MGETESLVPLRSPPTFPQHPAPQTPPRQPNALETGPLTVHLSAWEHRALDRTQALSPERKPPLCGGFYGVAGLEPATSWVRFRRPRGANLAFFGCPLGRV